ISPSAARPVNPYCPLNEARRRLREQCALAAFPRRCPYGLESYFLVLGEEPIITHNSHILYDDISMPLRNHCGGKVVRTSVRLTCFRNEVSFVRYYCRRVPMLTSEKVPLTLTKKVVKLNTVNKLQGHDLPFPKES
ncbi:hypothetical protein ALC57_04305, partial [Trachymyrmex cornetzi]